MWNPFNPNQQDPYSMGYNGVAGGDPIINGEMYGQPFPQMGNGYGTVRVTKQDLVNFIVQNLQASEVVRCDEFETAMTRHICPGTKNIVLLKSDTFNVPTPNGIVPVRVIFCPNCRKLWIDKNTLDFM